MRAYILTFIILFISTICFSQEESKLLDSLFTIMHDRGQFSGNVLITEDNNITFSKSYGFLDREKKKVLNEQTLFNVGSVSKAFTAIAILQLAENEKLNLSQKVLTYLPNFPYPNITIHHLLIHAGGLPNDYNLLDSLDKNTIATNNDILKPLYSQKPPLIFVPGERSEYSNLGYMILAEIVKKVSETEFNEYLQKYIFSPAKMTRTNIYNAEEIKAIENVAKGYVLYPFTGKYEEAINIPEFATNYVMSGFKGDGNVYSTTQDLLNFYTALSNDTFITKESLKTAFKKHIPAQMEGTPDFGHNYGYGWLILNSPKQIINRGGELPGYLSNTIWNITDNRLIIYLMNDYLAYTSYQHHIPMSIANIFYQNSVQIPKMTVSVELTKIVVTSSLAEISEKIIEIKNNPDQYQIDVPGLKFLVMKLEQLGDKEKSQLIMDNFTQD